MNYDFDEWNVPLIQEPYELMRKLKELDIKDRKITNIRCVGLCYNLTCDAIEDREYSYATENDIPENNNNFNLDNVPDDLDFNRFVEIDEPIIFTLDNGDRIEIDYSEETSIKIGKNSLPENISFGTNPPNVDMNVIFANCIGEKILGYTVEFGSEMSLVTDFTGSHGIEEPEKQEGFITKFRIILDNLKYIEFTSFFDYGLVSVYENHESKMLWKDIKNAIKEY